MHLLSPAIDEKFRQLASAAGEDVVQVGVVSVACDGKTGNDSEDLNDGFVNV